MRVWQLVAAVEHPIPTDFDGVFSSLDSQSILHKANSAKMII